MKDGPQPLRRAALPHGDAVGARQVLPAPRAGGGRQPRPPAAARSRCCGWPPACTRSCGGRSARHEETFATKSWQAELDRWEAEWKPDLLAANRAFTAVDLAALDDAGLAEHLEAVHAHLREHHAPALPAPRVRHGSARDAHGPARGLPASTGTTRSVRWSTRPRPPAPRPRGCGGSRPRCATRASTRRRLTSLDQVRAASPERGRAASTSTWRSTAGGSPPGYDIEDRCLGGAARRAARLHPRRRAGDGAGGRRAPRRDRRAPRRGARRSTAPRSTRPSQDARPSYGLRDENGPLTYEWPAGLLRRASSRPAVAWPSAGPSAAADEVFELRIAEVAALLTGRRRTRPRRDRRAGRHPAVGGHPRRRPRASGREEAPPPADALTPSLARMTTR